jgi:hypothetical protein
MGFGFEGYLLCVEVDTGGGHPISTNLMLDIG